MEHNAFAELMIEAVKQYVAESEKMLLCRISELENRLENMPFPEKGEKGDSVSPDEIRDIIQESLKKVDIPKGEKGDKGDSVSLEDIEGIIKGMVSAIKLPEPEKPDLAPIIGMVEDAIRRIPEVKDGISPKAEDVAKSLEGAMQLKLADWLIGRERIENERVEKFLSTIPMPKDGRDALDIEDIDIMLGQDGRTVAICLKRGEILIEKQIKLATILDRGVFRDGEVYEKGDAVSFGGSLFIVNCDNPKGKPGSSEDFRLAVKRGRDGRDTLKVGVDKPAFGTGHGGR